MKENIKKGNPLVWLLLSAIAVSVCAASIFSLHLKKIETEASARKRGIALASMTSTAMASQILAAAKYLELLSRFPGFWQQEKKDLLRPRINETRYYLLDCLDTLRFDMGMLYHGFLQMNQSMEYWRELSAAMQRRLFYEMNRIIGANADSLEDSENTGDEGMFIPPGDYSSSKSLRFYEETNFIRHLLLSVYIKLNSWFDELCEWGQHFDSFAGLGHTMLVDQRETEKFLSSALSSREWFAGLKITNRFGHPLTDFSQNGIDGAVDDYLICQNFSNGRSFWVGKTYHTDSQSSYLQMAVPVRNRNRKLTASIRAAFDLKNLEQIIEKGQIASECEIIVLDQNFATVFSSSSRYRKNQISYLRQFLNPSEVSGQKSQKTLYLNENSQRVSISPLSGFRIDRLPDWQVAIIEHINDSWLDKFYPGDFALIVLAGISLYVLFYSASKLLILSGFI
ncbi:MAG: hypothetical protein AB1403_08035 [Candidatus Riflebacteria bacterium]